MVEMTTVGEYLARNPNRGVQEFLKGMPDEAKKMPYYIAETEAEKAEVQKLYDAQYNEQGYENPECPDCKDKGYIQANGKLLPCKCRATTLQKRQLQNTKLYSLEQCYGKFDLSRNENAKKVAEKVRAYAAQKGAWLYLYGIAGAGKTHLALSVAIAVAKASGNGEIFSWSEITAAYKNFKDATARTNLFSKMKSFDVIVIDGFLDENKTYHQEACNDMVDCLFSWWKLHKKKVIFTSQFTPDALKAYSGSAYWRICEACQNGSFFVWLKK